MLKQLLLPILLVVSSISIAQVASQDQLEHYTQEWQGERFEDGRPKVSDAILARMKNISIEEAWGTLRNKGFHNQFAGNWMILHPGQAMVGRALTVQYMPNRPDYAKRMIEQGHADGRIGSMNSWPIDMLVDGDVYVADCFGKVVDGTLIGDNLGNSIYAKSRNGVVFDGGSRDLAGLQKIEGFNAWVKGWDPSFLQETMVSGINHPIRIGRAVVFPGDVVLAKEEGVIFIPAHLAETVVINAEFIMLRDEFGITRLKEGVYTPGQIDTRWTEEIKSDFLEWLAKNPDKLPMSRAELDAYLKDRNW
ncbi:MAG: RraA family protein [Bacteroidota bacterium]